MAVNPVKEAATVVAIVNSIHAGAFAGQRSSVGGRGG